MQRREEEYLWEVVAQLSDDLQLLEDTVPAEPGRASLVTAGTISAPESIPASNSQSRAIVEPDLSSTGRGQSMLVEMPDVVSTGIVTVTDAANLDSPGVTETMRETQILLQLKALTEISGDLPRASSVLKWSRMRGGQSFSVLECPFDRLGCHVRYSDLAAWFWHSLTHFQIDGHFPRTIFPPTSNTCCICEKRFTAARGINSWQQLLAHNAYHHLHGNSLADATPDIELYTYLWHNGLIDEVMYKEIKGMPQDSGFSVDKISSVDSVSPVPLGSEAVPATVLAERRLDRRRGLAWLRGR